MTVIRMGEIIKWMNFFLELRNSLSQIKSRLCKHEKQMSVLINRDETLLQHIKHQNEKINSLEQRIQGLERSLLEMNNIGKVVVVTPNSIQGLPVNQQYNVKDSLIMPTITE